MPWKKVKERAESIGVDQQKVLTWIHLGYLRAVDVSQSPGGRPRWRISDDDWAEFLASRSTQAAPPPPTEKPKRRRRTDSNVIEFY